jgi:site-specific DNA recombinase
LRYGGGKLSSVIDGRACQPTQFHLSLPVGCLGFGLRGQFPGTYQGGPVRFGYCVATREGLDRRPRPVLAISTDPMPGFEDPPLSEADVMREIYERVAADDSQQAVAVGLNRRGISPHPAAQAGVKQNGKLKKRFATKWTATRIGALIRDPIYKGHFAYGRWKRVWDEGGMCRAVKQDDPKAIIPVSCPAIVPEELWERANAASRRHNTQLRAHAKRDYLLSGLIRCATCGRTYVGSVIGGRRGRKVYRCSAHYRYKSLGLEEACPGPNINGRALESYVLDHLERFGRNPGSLAELEANLTSDQSKADAEREIKRLERELAEQAAEKERLLVLYRKGRIGEADLDRQYVQMDAERADKEAEIADRRQRLNDNKALQRRIAGARNIRASLRGKIESMAFADRRAAVESVVGDITIQKDGSADVPFIFEPDFARVLRGWALAGGLAKQQTLRRPVRRR